MTTAENRVQSAGRKRQPAGGTIRRTDRSTEAQSPTARSVRNTNEAVSDGENYTAYGERNGHPAAEAAVPATRQESALRQLKRPALPREESRFWAVPPL